MKADLLSSVWMMICCVPLFDITHLLPFRISMFVCAWSSSRQILTMKSLQHRQHYHWLSLMVQTRMKFSERQPNLTRIMHSRPKRTHLDTWWHPYLVCTKTRLTASTGWSTLILILWHLLGLTTIVQNMDRVLSLSMRSLTSFREASYLWQNKA